VTARRALFAIALLPALAGCPDHDVITGAADAAGPDAIGPLPDAWVGPDGYRPTRCQDFLDNDNDGMQDYPYDPGCADPIDDDETDDCPFGPGCPACSNGADDDGDGFVDLIDPGCISAADPDELQWTGGCGPSLALVDITGSGTGSGTFAGASPNEVQSDSCGGLGGELGFIYSVLAGPTTYVISTNYPDTTVDTVLYVRTSCALPSSEVACDDDMGGTSNGPSEIVTTLETGTYYIIVDTFGPGSLGDFVLTVTEVP
jgi:hypothetical protein